MTFFYSVMRRILLPLGIPIEYQDDGVAARSEVREAPPFKVYLAEGETSESLIAQVLRSTGFNYKSLERDSKLASVLLDQDFKRMNVQEDQIQSFEILEPLFYRNKHCYVVGRIRLKDNRLIPLVLPLLNPDGKMSVDAVLTDLADVSNVFSYTRSNFHVDMRAYRETVDFLESIMPDKGRAAILSAIGFVHPAKIEFVQMMRESIERTSENFEPTKGTEGWAMATFTHPSIEYVFKIIADHSSKYPTEVDIASKYRLVHEKDRVGRMLDTMLFKNMKFDRKFFPEELLARLKERAPSVVKEYFKVEENSISQELLRRLEEQLPLFVRVSESEVTINGDVFLGEMVERIRRQSPGLVYNAGERLVIVNYKNIFPRKLLHRLKEKAPHYISEDFYVVLEGFTFKDSFLSSLMERYPTSIEKRGSQILIQRDIFESVRDDIRKQIPDFEEGSIYPIQRIFISQELFQELNHLRDQLRIGNEGDVVFRKLYVQKKLIPLDYYLAYYQIAYYRRLIEGALDLGQKALWQEMIDSLVEEFGRGILAYADSVLVEKPDLESIKNEIKRVLYDFGQSIKDLALAGIWVGDVKTKNYGVTNSGRVVSYDYDEVGELKDYSFEEQASFYVPPSQEQSEWQESDYREEYIERRFSWGNNKPKMGIPQDFLDYFNGIHGDLFEGSFLRKIQKRLLDGDVPDVFSYSQKRRLENFARVVPVTELNERFQYERQRAKNM
ncbi:MAG: bifunctional isocitrate dehydrogenase kinase/phosphatase [Chlamydiae bacterium]|nr:bifunctional isocitrate dehydrogenase kinase/phosphatase [Chlamydiota bacterium]